MDHHRRVGDVPVVRRPAIPMSRTTLRDTAGIVHTNPANRSNAECIYALSRGWAFTDAPVTCLWCTAFAYKKGTDERIPCP